MLKTKIIKVKWNPKNKKYYENKGYIYTKNKDEFEVYISELSTGSEIKVEVECDYCGRVFIKTYCEYIKQNINSIIHKDCCMECRNIKRKESNLLQYNVENTSSLIHVKNKTKNTWLNNYGVDNPMKNEDIKNKAILTNYEKYNHKFYSQTNESKERALKTNMQRYGAKTYLNTKEGLDKLRKTNLNKYGCEYVTQVEEFKNKKVNTNLSKYGTKTPCENTEIKMKQIKTLYQNGTAPCSNQQKYIYNLIGGELNYPFSRCNLDIAFTEEMIYIECDFGGHELSVKLGNETKEEFNERQRKRWYALYNNNWKEIRIISITDKIPQDDKIIEIIQYAKEYLNSGHSWIHFDIDNGKIICSQYEKEYNFGELRKITKNDLIKEVV